MAVSESQSGPGICGSRRTAWELVEKSTLYSTDEKVEPGGEMAESPGMRSCFSEAHFPSVQDSLGTLRAHSWFEKDQGLTTMSKTSIPNTSSHRSLQGFPTEEFSVLIVVLAFRFVESGVTV